MDHPNLNDAIRVNDTDTLKTTFDKVNLKGNQFIESQKDQIKDEFSLSENTFEYMYTIYFVIFIQVLIILLLSGYQIFSFRKVILDLYFY